MSASQTRAVLTHLYDALARRDGAAMAALYAPDASFEDPVFRLHGRQIGAMWIELTRRAKDFGISYTITQADSGRGTVESTARYRFGTHPVVNRILSEIEIEDGRIVRQRDRFDFPRWAAQALGLPGRLLGRFSWFQKAVSRRAMRSLGLRPPAPPV